MKEDNCDECDFCEEKASSFAMSCGAVPSRRLFCYDCARFYSQELGMIVHQLERIE